MMTEHPDFDDIVDAIYADEMTPDNMRLIHRVQAHVMKCETCRQTYETILAIKEWQEGEHSEVEPATISLSGLLKNAVVNLSVSISDGCRLSLERLQQMVSAYEYSFEHPVAIAARSGAGEEDLSSLVDEENDYNRLKVDKNQLTISLDAEDWSEGIPVLIVTDAEGHVCCCDEMKPVDGRYRLVVPIQADGVYDIVIGKTHE